MTSSPGPTDIASRARWTADVPDGESSEMLRELVPPAAARLASGDAPGGGKAGKYWVTWTDPYSIGGAGFGLVDALDRRGFDVGVEPRFERGYGWMFSRHIRQAHEGCDFDFLETGFGASPGEPAIL